MIKRLVLWILLLASSLLVAPAAFADAPIEGSLGRDEIRYMTQMMDHHSMSVMMSNDCLTKAETEEVLSLCQRILDAQMAEIEELRGWLLSWYGIDYDPMSMMGMMQGGMDTTSEASSTEETTMMPMDMPMSGMMVVLMGLEGQPYEVVFMETMIEHHDQAIHMSERLLERAADGHAELLEFAQRVIDDQSAEIAEMETLIAERQ